MGFSGCGKTTILKMLSETLNLPFFDADDFHPEANIVKMAKGLPLNDSDSMPWLRALAVKLNEWSSQEGAILACSALKESYREHLNSQFEQIHWIYLDGTYERIEERLLKRKDHFFKPDLLASQFEALEIPDYGVHVDIDDKPERVIDSIIKKMDANA